MFLLNVGYDIKTATDVEGLNGIILLPSGNYSYRIEKHTPFEYQKVLCDPQMYLAELEIENCPKHCARLASYPWFNVEDIPPFEEGVTKPNDWKQEVDDIASEKWPGQHPTDDGIYESCYKAIDFQIKNHCTHIISPAPLIKEREDEAAIQAKWLDEGLSVSEEFELTKPVMATVAIDESTLNENAFSEGGFLETVVDQITSRAELDGVYVLIIQTHRCHPFFVNMLVYRAYAYLTKRFYESNLEYIILNFSDLFGAACTAFGATNFATGSSQALRQISYEGFQELKGGMALPFLYSHKAIAELSSESDLNMVRDARVLNRIMDISPYSRPLIDKLSSGGSAAELPNWAEEKNIYRTAHRHFIFRLCQFGLDINNITTIEGRLEMIREWLQVGAANKLYIESKIETQNLKGRFAPSDEWLRIIEELND